MRDLTNAAREVVDALERNDVDAVRTWRSERLLDWSPAEWIRDRWLPRMADIAGGGRQVGAAREVTEVMARVAVAGDRGEAFVTVDFDGAGKLIGLDIKDEDIDHGFGICIGCDREQAEELEAFYRRLVSTPLGFGEGLGRAPRWPDPAYPQQMHLDVLVPDLATAEAEVLAGGATRLRDSGHFRVYADPVGHPFCLYRDDSGSAPEGDALGRLERVVIDCPDPQVLAVFWGGLLDMPRRVEGSADRVVVAGERPPMIALQRVPDYQAPRWPDAMYPAQVHFDVSFDDRETKERLALELGATRLPPQGGSCPVYADPAGHPFCLCRTGE